jgi:hypothetical protein
LPRPGPENSALEPDVVVAHLSDAEGVRLARPPVVAHVTGNEAFRARKPFDVEIVPDRLVAKLRRR